MESRYSIGYIPCSAWQSATSLRVSEVCICNIEPVFFASSEPLSKVSSSQTYTECVPTPYSIRPGLGDGPVIKPSMYRNASPEPGSKLGVNPSVIGPHKAALTPVSANVSPIV